jgi:voltage-dependent potassium channel beta subunit
MEYRRMGKSGLELSALSLGSWVTFGNQIGDHVASELMAMAFDHGVNFFDNAEIYAEGHSEEVMGKLLQKLRWRRDRYVLSSKVYWGGKYPNQTGLSRKHIHEACNASLKRLRVSYVDLYFCHRPDKNTPIEETVRAMNTLIQAGKILYWGTSEWEAADIQSAISIAKSEHLIPPVVEQPQYNMFHRERMELEYRKLFRDHGMGTTIWSPLASGLLTGKYKDSMPGNTRASLPELTWLKAQLESDSAVEKMNKLNELNDIAIELGCSLPQLAIAWCLANQNVSTVLLGASQSKQLQENLNSLEYVSALNPIAMERIDSILGNTPKLPAFG